MKIRWHLSFKKPHPEIVTAHQHTENLCKWKYIDILFLVLEIKDGCINIREEKQCFESLIISYCFQMYILVFFKIALLGEWNSHSVETICMVQFQEEKPWILFSVHLLSDLVSLNNSSFIFFSYLYGFLYSEFERRVDSPSSVSYIKI